MPWEFTPLGDSAFRVRIGDSLGTALALTRRLEEAHIRGVVDIAPAFASIGIFFASPEDLTNATNTLHAILRGRAPARSEEPKTRLLDVPVCYEPEYGPDLEVVSKVARLSPHEIALRHATASYRVRCVGFTPGFPYLEGLPKILATPRRASPRLAVPAGAVAIGGAQTGIYPLASPGGWNLIGRTPLRLFDAKREPAALLAAGDRVRFFAITAEQFRQWEA
ncbi:MAG: 5-oxoprolinase subunit PxpB [Chthoniobacterales bacterium]